jgi:hypothetical protein
MEVNQKFISVAKRYKSTKKSKAPFEYRAILIYSLLKVGEADGVFVMKKNNNSKNLSLTLKHKGDCRKELRITSKGNKIYFKVKKTQCNCAFESGSFMENVESWFGKSPRMPNFTLRTALKNPKMETNVNILKTEFDGDEWEKLQEENRMQVEGKFKRNENDTVIYFSKLFQIFRRRIDWIWLEPLQIGMEEQEWKKQEWKKQEWKKPTMNQQERKQNSRQARLTNQSRRILFSTQHA